MDIESYVYHITYLIKTNSGLNEMESYRVACAISPFIDDMIAKGVSNKIRPLTSAIDALTSAVEEEIKRKNSGYKLSGENNG